MKRERKLMAVSGALAVCIAGTILISRMDFEEKMTGTETVIVDVDSEKITSLSWEYEGEELSFARGDEEDSGWTCTADDRMSVDQELLDQIAANLSDIRSDKKVEEVQSLSVYGLSDPSYRITVGTEEETYEIEVGDETFSDGEVYISTGDGYVYLTDAGLIDDISYGLLDYVQKEEIPEMDSVTEVKVENGASVDIVYKKNSGYCYSDAYTYYLKEDGAYRNLDNENTQSLFTTLTEFTWGECVDYYAEDDELGTYGLDDPEAGVSVAYKTEDSDEKQKFEYEVGEADGSWYAKLKDSRIVYRIGEDIYTAAKDASYEDLKPDEILLLDWDTVDGMEIESDENTYVVEMEKDGDDAYICTLDGEEIGFGDVLDRLLEITAAEDGGDGEESSVPEEGPDPGGRKLELKFTFRRNTEEHQTVELEFYQYDGSYCISVLDGEEMQYTDRTSVIDLKEAVESAVLDSGAAD